MTAGNQMVDTLKNDQNQSNIPQRQKRLLPVNPKNVAQRHAVDEPDDDLPDEPCADGLVGEPFCDGEEDEEGEDG